MREFWADWCDQYGIFRLEPLMLLFGASGSTQHEAAVFTGQMFIGKAWFCFCWHIICLFLTEGEHTLTKTIVTSKIGKLALFTKKRSTCIGCKALLDDEGETSCWISPYNTNFSLAVSLGRVVQTLPVTHILWLARALKMEGMNLRSTRW